MKKLIYKNIFFYSSLQFCGHIDEYLTAHSEKCVAYVLMPRLKSQFNLIRLYRHGKLIEEKKVLSSDNIFLYYMLWYAHYLYFLYTYFSRDEALIVFSGHPLPFFLMSVQKLLRRVTFAYWIGDYYPPVKFELILFEKLKKFYHDRIGMTYYLSDIINKKMNGKIISKTSKRTVMWGLRRELPSDRPISTQHTLLFVGVVKGTEGLELIFHFLAKHKIYKLNIIGICSDTLYRKYQKLIRKLNIDRQIFFPNRFFSQKELRIIAMKCFLGVAVYDDSPMSATYYTDPGKVKAYAELGLPVIMSKTSAIAPFVQHFKSGVTIDVKEKSLERAIIQIAKNRKLYVRGLERFISYFDYEQYYRNAFRSFENIAS